MYGCMMGQFSEDIANIGLYVSEGLASTKHRGGVFGCSFPSLDHTEATCITGLESKA